MVLFFTPVCFLLRNFWEQLENVYSHVTAQTCRGGHLKMTMTTVEDECLLLTPNQPLMFTPNQRESASVAPGLCVASCIGLTQKLVISYTVFHWLILLFLLLYSHYITEYKPSVWLVGYWSGVLFLHFDTVLICSSFSFFFFFSSLILIDFMSAAGSVS